MNNQDNEKQMVSSLQIILTGAPSSFWHLTTYTVEICCEFCSSGRVRGFPRDQLCDRSHSICFIFKHPQYFSMQRIWQHEIKCTAPNTDPCIMRSVITTWTSRSLISYETWRAHTQLLRYESVRVCQPEVTQHADINLSEAAWVKFNKIKG